MNILKNKKAFHDYFIEDKYEAGIVLKGWEVKSIRSGKGHLKESYVVIKGGEIYLIGCHISPITSISNHTRPDPTRSRKLLLKSREIKKLIGNVERAGYTIVPLNMHFSKGRIKLEIGLAKGKKQYDKRESLKQKDWQKEQARILKNKKNF